MLRRCVFGLFLGLFSGVASASEGLTSGEMYRTAHTPEAGEFVWHPLFYPSQVGIIDPLSVSFGTLSMIPGAAPKLGDVGLGFLNGPSIGLEYAPIESDEMALSVGPRFQMNWDGVWNMFGANARFTKSVGKSRINAGLGFHQLTIDLASQASEEEAEFLSFLGFDRFKFNMLPIDVSFDLVASSKTVFRFGFVYSPIFGETVAKAKKIDPDFSPFLLVPDFGWYQAAGKVFRYSLGAKLLKVPGGGGDSDLPAYLPMPDIQFWFKF